MLSQVVMGIDDLIKGKIVHSPNYYKEMYEDQGAFKYVIIMMY